MALLIQQNSGLRKTIEHIQNPFIELLYHDHYNHCAGLCPYKRKILHFLNVRNWFEKTHRKHCPCADGNHGGWGSRQRASCWRLLHVWRCVSKTPSLPGQGFLSIKQNILRVFKIQICFKATHLECRPCADKKVADNSGCKIVILPKTQATFSKEVLAQFNPIQFQWHVKWIMFGVMIEAFSTYRDRAIGWHASSWGMVAALVILELIANWNDKVSSKVPQGSKQQVNGVRVSSARRERRASYGGRQKRSLHSRWRSENNKNCYWMDSIRLAST